VILFPSLTGQLPDDVRAVEVELSICDDLLPQFAFANEIGRQFSDALVRRRRASNPTSRPARRIHDYDHHGK
jgi:hypothetical protein